MLRFFRKYIMNRWVLVIGGILLMIVFLLPSGFRRGQGASDAVIGRIGGQKIRQSQYRQAGDQLEVLGRIHPLLQLTAAKSAAQWMLMLYEARQLGVSASEAEAYEVLAAFNLNQQDVQRVARRLAVPPPYVLNVLREYAMVWRYKPLIYGLAYMPLRDRLQFFQSLYQMYGPQAMAAADRLLPGLIGYPRLSRPLAERMMYDQFSTVSIAALPVEAQRFAAQAAPPTPQRLQELFDQYRDALPGQGQYGIGFQLPDRVKIEYLVIPAPRLLEKSRITEAQALDYYEQHRQEFQLPATTQPTQQFQPYAQVRTQIVDQLRRQQAQDLADRVVVRARSHMMGPDASKLTQQDGYYVLPSDWHAPTLRETADQIQQEFGLRPDLRIYDQNWLTATELASLQGIYEAVLAGGRVQAPFAQYALSAHELQPKTNAAQNNNPLLVERLQARVPSQVLIDRDGTRYIFRLIEAQPQRAPQNLEEVRPDVEAAARCLDAYQTLLAQRDQWLQRAQAQPLEKIAAELNAEIQTPPAFPRLTRSPLGGLQPPMVLDLPPASGFVEKVFELAQTRGAVDTPQAKPVTVIPADSKLALYLVRLENFHPMPREQYQRLAAGESLKGFVAASLALGVPEDPLSYEALSHRLNFITERETEQPSQTQQAPSE
jgi:hypothetical protein